MPGRTVGAAAPVSGLYPGGPEGHRLAADTTPVDVWRIRPVLEEKLARLQELRRGNEAAVVRRCIDLIRAATPELALREWLANRALVEVALGMAATSDPAAGQA